MAVLRVGASGYMGKACGRPPMNTLLLGGRHIYLNSFYSVQRSTDEESIYISHTSFQVASLGPHAFQVFHGLHRGEGRNSQALGTGKMRRWTGFQSSNGRGDGVGLV